MIKKNIKHFVIKDILHTGHHGTAGTSKCGEKYDNRRGRIIKLDMDSLSIGESLKLIPVIAWTTPYEKSFYDVEGIFHLVTLNSEYILAEVEA